MSCSQVNTFSVHSDYESYFAAKVKGFKGGQLRFYFKHWENITSDPEILTIVRGDVLDFISVPPICHGGRSITLSPKEKVLVSVEIQSLLDREIIVPSIHEKLEYVSPIFPVFNKFGKSSP